MRKLAIVHEDEEIIVVDKNAGLAVQGGARVGASLDDVLALHLGARPFLVHRLDKDTSGLILVAKNDYAHKNLAEQIKAHTIKREYIALVHGVIKENLGTIDAPIGRSKLDRKKMAVIKNGRPAVSNYEVISSFHNYTLIKVSLLTGRTHQIRVHLASVGHAVVGDPVYGRRRTHLPLERQFLHAGHLGFQHPVTGQRLELDAPLPADLAGVLELLRKG